MNSQTEWRFTPYDLEKWNSSTSRVIMVATEPNGGNPNSGYPDMGDWFRTANSANKYHRNKLFHNRCKLMLSGALGVSDNTVFDHLRFVDLKATEGGASSDKREIRQYLLRNISDVIRYFVSEDEKFGKYPHKIILLGNSAFMLFDQYVLPHLMERPRKKQQWICMPHPSAQTVANDMLERACLEMPYRFRPLTERPFKWFCRGRSNSGWKEA